MLVDKSLSRLKIVQIFSNFKSYSIFVNVQNKIKLVINTLQMFHFESICVGAEVINSINDISDTFTHSFGA